MSTFFTRMQAETGTPMPRWLYLALKPIETVALGVFCWHFLGLSLTLAAWLVFLVYVGIGLLAWYRHRQVTFTLARGAFLGDLAYHGLCSLPAVLALAYLWPTWLRLMAILVALLLWWALDINGYGPARNPTTGLPVA